MPGGDAPPSRDRASSTAASVAFAGSGSVESAAPILISLDPTPAMTISSWLCAARSAPSTDPGVPAETLAPAEFFRREILPRLQSVPIRAMVQATRLNMPTAR